MVAPFAGAWIEISDLDQRSTAACVAPFAGAWIEISNGHWLVVGTKVAPFAGAWIEIGSSGQRKRRVSASLPSRERGLKSA